MSKLETLLAKSEQAKAAAEAELLRMYPPGSVIQFTIYHGQRNPSTGTVACVGYSPGHVRVKHHQAKPYSRYAYREVHFSRVLG